MNAYRSRGGTRGGFTLLELLTVMAIMALMLSLAMMAFNDMGRGSGFRGATLEFKSALSLARQHAITQRSHSGVVYGNNDEGRGFYYMTNAHLGTVGTTNFLVLGIQLASQDGPDSWETGPFQARVEFRIDGGCDTTVGYWNSQRRMIRILETGGENTMSNTFKVYAMTGRAKVESGDRN